VQHSRRSVGRKHLIQAGTIQQVTLFKGPEFDRLFPPGGQVVETHRHISSPGQRLAGMRADIAGAASHKDTALPGTFSYCAAFWLETISWM